MIDIVRTLEALGKAHGKSRIPLPTLQWTQEAELAFQRAEKAITDARIFHHFHPAKPIILQTDASGFAITGISIQYEGLHIPCAVNFYSPNSSPAKQNYETYDGKLLPIAETIKKWQHYLEGANDRILTKCDHKNLGSFQISKVLS
jgi:hypothetical protein